MVNLVNLESLNIGCCDRLTDDGLFEVCDLPLLKNLDISACKITDNGLYRLKNLVKLESLVMKYCDWITDAGFVEVCSLPRLKRVDATLLAICAVKV